MGVDPRWFVAIRLRFTLGLCTDLICEAKDPRPEAQKKVQPERESQ
jgi:hypothetical protein